MEKKIGILSAVLSALCLMSLFLSPFQFSLLGYFSFFSYQSLDFLSFQLGGFDSLFYVNTNVVSFAMTLLFAIGTILYFTSNYKNFAILRFIYGVILFNMVVFFPLKLVHLYAVYFGLDTNFYNPYPASQQDISIMVVILMIVSMAYAIALIIIPYKIVKHFNSNLQLKYDEIDYGYSKSRSFFEAKLLTRFVHLLVDNIILYSVFYSFFHSLVYYSFASEILSEWEKILGERTLLFILICLARIIYFLFFECQFRATPAKFLTHTKVMYYDGSAADNKAIVIRTLSRLFPLESLTYLFGFNLHDNWSSTAVFEEVSTEITKEV